MSRALVLLICFALSHAAGIKKRMNNGTPFSDAEATGMVSLQDEAGIHFCQGMLVTDLWFVSAGVCFFESREPDVFKRPLESIRVVAGLLNLRTSEGQTRHPVFLHYPTQSITNKEFDLTLGKLNEPFSISGTVQLPVIAPAPTDIRTVLWTFGWGIGDSDDLKYLRMKMAFFSKSCTLPKEWTFCAETHRKSYGGEVCSIDAGGLLTSNDGVVGILLGGSAECSSDAVYARLSYYTTWIQEYIAESS